MPRVTARGVDQPVVQLRQMKKDLCDMTDEELDAELEKSRSITQMAARVPSASRGERGERKPVVKPKPTFDPNNVF